jgi:mannose/fructose/N-acetylgalactosamine-specific phosphotransferase system component IID
MQKSIFQKVMSGIVCVTLLTACVWFLSKTGMEPLWATICIILAKGVIRFVYRLIVTLVSIAITIVLFITLLTCI